VKSSLFCSDIGTNYKNAICDQNVECLGIKQLGSHLTNFNDILHLRIYRKSRDKIQFSLQSLKNNRYFKRRPIDIYDHISLISS